MRLLGLVLPGVCLSWLALSACGPSTPTESDLAATRDAFPTQPNLSMTPGSLCDRPDAYRYPEHIAYCNRAVESSTKRAIIAEYDRRFGYHVGSMDRADFKIDHFIPLCMGGSNAVKNLWPQHKTVYARTDSIEQKACELMARGKMRQTAAVALIKRVKLDLSQSEPVSDDLDQQLSR